MNVHAGETLTAHASLTRRGHLLAKAAGQLTPGWHALRIAVPSGVAGGAATARIVLADAAGNTRTLTKSVRLPS